MEKRERVNLSIINERLERLERTVVTKADLEGLASKADLEGLASKADLDGLASKADLDGLASKADLDGLASKDDLDGLASKADLEGLASKVELEGLRDEIRKAAEGYGATLERIERNLEEGRREHRARFDLHDLTLQDHARRLDALEKAQR